MAKYSVKYRYRRPGSNSWTTSMATFELGVPDVKLAENSARTRISGVVEEVQVLDMKKI